MDTGINIPALVELDKLRAEVWENYTKVVCLLEKTGQPFFRTEDKVWHTYSWALLRTMLTERGFFAGIWGENKADLLAKKNAWWQKFQNHVATHNIVKAAGLLGGYSEGVIEQAFGKFLITDSPKIILPVKGDWSFLRHILTQQLSGLQLDLFHAWIRHAYLNVSQQWHAFFLLLFLVGPAQCGKSLIQRQVITQILGGRFASPYTHMVGATNFNSEVAAADHLLLEDKGFKKNNWDPIQWMQNLKNVAVGKSVRIEGKGQDAYNIEPATQALSLSVNEEDHNFMTIPALVPSMVDKMLALRCSKVDFGVPSLEIEPLLKPCLPGYLYDLLNGEVKIDKSVLTTDRFGVTPYIQPQIIDFLTEVSTESQIRDLLDAYMDSISKKIVEGTGGQIHGMLAESEATRDAYRRLRQTSGSLGVKLTAFAEKLCPERFLKHSRTSEGSLYTIFRHVNNGNHKLL